MKWLICSAVFLLIHILPLYAVDMGGSAELQADISLNESNEIDYEIIENTDIEIFIPKIGNNDIKCEFIIYKPLQGLIAGKEMSIFFKKLYLRSKFPYAKLTIGRQPVSWSFGSMINAVDYVLGSTALSEENNSKYTDACELYIPLNWNSGISLIASFPDGFTSDMHRLKSGARIRMGIMNYDITLNYVREADTLINGINALAFLSIIPSQRIAMTFKGDLLDLGIYGAAGYYFDNIDNGFFSYMLGIDYSFFLNYKTKIIVQTEYLGIDVNDLPLYLKIGMLKMDSTDNRLDMGIITMNYPIDEFSSFTMTGIVNADDYSFILSPMYQILLPFNIDLKLSGFMFAGKENTLFSQSSLMMKFTSLLSLTYQW